MDLMWTSSEELKRETERCYAKFENIQSFYDLQTKLYGKKGVLFFADHQIDAVSYNSGRRTLTVRITDNCENFKYEGKTASKVFYVFQFCDVDDLVMDIAPEFRIFDLYIQKMSDDRYLYWCDSGMLNFTFGYARADRWWAE